MILSDRDIQQALNSEFRIEPFTQHQLQPSSYDVQLAPFLWVADKHLTTAIDLGDPPSKPPGEQVSFEEYVLHPGQFVLGATNELIELGGQIVARLEGKSSLGRLGLIVHATAGYVDPGFSGHLTLELLNIAQIPIILRPNILIAQLTFHRMSSPALNPYGTPGLGSKYQHQPIQPVPFRRDAGSQTSPSR